MKRILILGSSGSGKSTLARRLGATLELPVIHLDRHFWHPGWVKTPHSDWVAHVKQLVEREAWIMDGNYRSTLDMRMKAADTVIFLDMPRWLCVIRAIKRRIEYMNRPRPDIAHGCKERILDPKFPGFLQHVWDYPSRARPDIKQRLAQYGDNKTIIWLRSRKDVQAFLVNPYHPHFYYDNRQRPSLSETAVEPHSPGYLADLYD